MVVPSWYGAIAVPSWLGDALNNNPIICDLRAFIYTIPCTKPERENALEMVPDLRQFDRKYLVTP
ncbi:hypothetical protein ABIC11_004520 [Pseudomonas oryzihabitans]